MAILIANNYVDGYDVFTCLNACFDVSETQSYLHLEQLHNTDYSFPTVP